MKRLLIGTMCATIAVLATAWGFTAGAATRSVDVQDNAFSDSVSSTSTTTINVGDTVQWMWSGSNPHTVDNNGGSESFSSGAPQDTGTFSHTFNTAGTYNYICGVHGTAMQGTVIVQAAQTPTNTAVAASTSTQTPQAGTATSVPSSTSTPVATTTAASTSPTPGAAVAGSPTAVVPEFAAPSGSAGAGGELPSTGQGEAGGNAPVSTLLLVGAALVAGGAAVLLARHRVRS